MERIINIHLRLVDLHSGEPVSGKGYNVTLHDSDVLKDDNLGSGEPDPLGHVIISITQSDFRSADSPYERYPDLYFRVLRQKEVIYEGKIYKNVDLEGDMGFSGDDGTNFNLGTFAITTT